LLDWGLAKPFARTEVERASGEQSLAPQLGTTPAGETMMGSAMGTPAYMSPEQAAGRWNVVGPASDVYSLGATLYHLLTGQAPFGGEDQFAVLAAVQHGDFPPPREINPDVPRPLDPVRLQALAHGREGRWARGRALGADVEHWLADEPVEAYHDFWPARLGRWTRRHRSATAAAAALLVTAVVGLAVGLTVVEREHNRTAQAL